MVRQFINSLSNSAVIDLELDNSEEKSLKKLKPPEKVFQSYLIKKLFL